MIPLLCESTRSLVPEVCFGGEHAPKYFHMKAPEDKSIGQIDATLRIFGGG
jgi:hypothetical protein